MVKEYVVYMYEYYSVIKKAECEGVMLLNFGVGEDSLESFGVQGDQTSLS